MTHVLGHHNCFALCQYDRRLFPPELILDVIRTHPTVIYRGNVCRNMHDVPPDELLGTNQATASRRPCSSSSRGGEAASGVGIAGMSERIEQAGGRLEITSSDRGTTVRVRLPLMKEAG